MDNNNTSKIATIGVTTLIVGALLGVGLTKAFSHPAAVAASSVAPSSATKAADLRANLVTLGVVHMDLTDSAVSAALDGTPDAKALAGALFTNGDQIGAAVGSVYGPDAEATFNTVWKLHLNDFVKYAVASKTGNDTAKAAALTDINSNYTIPLAQYLAKANPNLPEAVLEGSLRDHVNMTATMIDDHVKGDYAAEATMRDQGAQHLNGLFSTLAGAIVTQYPSKF
jgi:hypothetical protein